MGDIPTRFPMPVRLLSAMHESLMYKGECTDAVK